MSPTANPPTSSSAPGADTAAPPSPPPGPSIVSNIPVHSPEGPAAAAVSDDHDLDKLMRDVGAELKKTEQQPRKKRFGWFGRKPKSHPAASHPAAPAPAAAAPPPPLPPQPQATSAKTAKPVAPAKAPGKHPVPLTVILATALVTGALIAVAYYTYK